jgi:CheY-like chemotaxis protein
VTFAHLAAVNMNRRHFVSNLPSHKLRTILLVDDRDDVRLTTKWFLGNFGFVVESARNAEEALAVFDPKVHDLVITDNSMPGMSGVEMAHVIKLRSVLTPVLMSTVHIPEDTSCVDLVLERPVHLLRLRDAAEQLIADKVPARV